MARPRMAILTLSTRQTRHAVLAAILTIASGIVISSFNKGIAVPVPDSQPSLIDTRHKPTLTEILQNQQANNKKTAAAAAAKDKVAREKAVQDKHGKQKTTQSAVSGTHPPDHQVQRAEPAKPSAKSVTHRVGTKPETVAANLQQPIIPPGRIGLEGTLEQPENEILKLQPAALAQWAQPTAETPAVATSTPDPHRIHPDAKPAFAPISSSEGIGNSETDDHKKKMAKNKKRKLNWDFFTSRNRR